MRRYFVHDGDYRSHSVGLGGHTESMAAMYHSMGFREVDRREYLDFRHHFKPAGEIHLYLNAATQTKLHRVASRKNLAPDQFIRECLRAVLQQYPD